MKVSSTSSAAANVRVARNLTGDALRIGSVRHIRIELLSYGSRVFIARSQHIPVSVTIFIGDNAFAWNGVFGGSVRHVSRYFPEANGHLPALYVTLDSATGLSASEYHEAVARGGRLLQVFQSRARSTARTSTDTIAAASRLRKKKRGGS